MKDILFIDSRTLQKLYWTVARPGTCLKRTLIFTRGKLWFGKCNTKVLCFKIVKTFQLGTRSVKNFRKYWNPWYHIPSPGWAEWPRQITTARQIMCESVISIGNVLYRCFLFDHNNFVAARILNGCIINVFWGVITWNCITYK